MTKGKKGGGTPFRIVGKGQGKMYKDHRQFGLPINQKKMEKTRRERADDRATTKNGGGATHQAGKEFTSHIIPGCCASGGE